MCESLKSEYHLCEEIGRGRFGVVYRCFFHVSGDSFACKSINKRELSNQTNHDCLEKEPKILQLLSANHNILQIYRVFEDETYLHIITDLCDSSNLYDRISKRTFFEPEAASIVKSLIGAIVYCHRLGIAHRDIKPNNVFFDSRNRLKLTDFGSAEWFRVDEDRTISGIVGMPYYVAPEVLSGRDNNEKIDVWSVGVILYIMLAGFPPFYGDPSAETFQAVLHANLRFPTKSFRSVSPEVKDLLKKMLCKDVSRRFSAEQVLSK